MPLGRGARILGRPERPHAARGPLCAALGAGRAAPVRGALCMARRRIREDLRPPVSVSAPEPRTRPQRRREATHACSWLARAAETGGTTVVGRKSPVGTTVPVGNTGLFWRNRVGSRTALAKSRRSARQCGWQTALVGRGAGWQRGAGWKNAAGGHASDGWQNASACIQRLSARPCGVWDGTDWLNAAWAPQRSPVRKH